MQLDDYDDWLKIWIQIHSWYNIQIWLGIRIRMGIIYLNQDYT